MPLENLKKNKDQPINTAIVAGGLCLVCALVVSTAASALKTTQENNKTLDLKKNLLVVTGFGDDALASRESIEQAFEENFEPIIIDMQTGEPALDACMAALKEIGKDWNEDEVLEKYDQFAMAKTKQKAVSDPIDKKEDPANVKYREKFSHVYILNDENGEPKTYVFPVRGYGLWSMMRGFLAVKPDFQTVEGIVFYDQAETPGLGGEVKSERFVTQWPGKQIYAEDGEVQIRVIKGADDDHSIDALSGATITSNGVTNAMEYWMGPQGFKNFIDRQKGLTPSDDEETQTSASEKPETGVQNG